MRYVGKIEIGFTILGAIASISSVALLVIQSNLLRKQTESLEDSVISQKEAFAESQAKNRFEGKQFLMDRFMPNVIMERLPGEFRHDENKFSFPWKATNLGDAPLTAISYFSYDLVRCFNEKFWLEGEWRTRQYLLDQFAKAEGEIDVEAIGGIQTRTLHSKKEATFGYTLDFPESAFSNFQEGERVAVEIYSLLYDSAQGAFRDEIRTLGFTHGGPFVVGGRPIGYPAVFHLISRVEMFQLREDKWELVENQESCIRLL